MSRRRLSVAMKLRRLRRAVRTGAIATTVALSAAAGAALAYWTDSGQFTASATVSTLHSPTISSATPGVEQVALTWSAVSPPGSGAVEYYVTRDGGEPSAGCPSIDHPSTVTSCTDSEVALGIHTYTVTAIWRTWSAISAEQSVTVTSGLNLHFVLEAASVTPGAGEADSLTITAKNASNQTVTTYTGSHSLIFEGAGESPNGSSPRVTNEAGVAVKFGEATAIEFTAGKATVSGATNGVMRLYKIEATHIKVKQGTTNNGAGLAVTVKAGEASSFKLESKTAEPTAGTAFNVAITALDPGGNTATSYAGNKTLAYSGPEISPNGKAPEYPATATAVKFTEGVGTAKKFKLYKAGATLLTATEATKTGSTSFTLKPGVAKSLALVFAPLEATAGVGDELTIRALDVGGTWQPPTRTDRTASFSAVPPTVRTARNRS